jgi:hypothetical protein
MLHGSASAAENGKGKHTSGDCGCTENAGYAQFFSFQSVNRFHDNISFEIN